MHESDVIRWQRRRYTLGTMFNVLADQFPVVAILLTFYFHTKILGNTLSPAVAFAAIGALGRVQQSFSVIPSTLQVIALAKVSLGRLANFLNQPDIDQTRLDVSDGSIEFDRAKVGWPAAGEESFKLHVDLVIPERQITLICGALGSGKTLMVSDS